MDKYKILENKLNDIITKLNQEIEEKQKEHARKIELYKEENAKKEETEKELNDAENDLRFLKIFENKNVFITAIKECNKSLGRCIKEADKFETIITIMLLLFIVLASIFLPSFGIYFVSIIVALESIFGIFTSRVVKKIRKKANIPDLEKKIKTLEEELSKKEEQEKQENEKLEDMLNKINSLIEERDLYIEDLENAKEARMQVLEQILDVNVLNEMYDKAKIEESLNMRTRKINKE